MKKVEIVFEHCGFACVVVMQDLGHRCAYVGVPKGHKFYNLDYYCDEMMNIECHGGLTYSGDGSNSYPIATDEELWWFGWDYAHYGDGIDKDAYCANFGKEEYQKKLEKGYFEFREGIVTYLEEIIEECMDVAEQMI